MPDIGDISVDRTVHRHAGEVVVDSGRVGVLHDLAEGARQAVLPGDREILAGEEDHEVLQEEFLDDRTARIIEALEVEPAYLCSQRSARSS